MAALITRNMGFECENSDEISENFLIDMPREVLLNL